MTKIDIEQGKPVGPEPLSPVTAPPMYSSQAQIDNSAEMKQSCVWYVLSILVTIFCCLPCGVVGIVHSMLAHHDGEMGRVGPQRRRLRKAKCWTCVSFGLGLLVLVLLLVWLVLGIRYYQMLEGTGGGNMGKDSYDEGGRRGGDHHVGYGGGKHD